jgi:hypothetical protein
MREFYRTCRRNPAVGERAQRDYTLRGHGSLQLLDRVEPVLGRQAFLKSETIEHHASRAQ